MKYVIIGNGAAGTEAALAIRKLDEDSPITLITESRFLHYFRPKLIHFLAEENQKPEDLMVYDEEFYAKKQITNILSRKITTILPQEKVVADQWGARYPYEKLLLATGSKPFVPPIEGIDKKGIFTLRSVTDVERIRLFSETVEEVLVIGGGLLGLENAFSLQQLGKKVTVVEFAPWLLPRQLDEAGGKHLQVMLEAKGLNFILGDSVVQFLGDRRVTQARLKSGRTIPAPAVLVSAGVRGDMDFLSGSGIQSHRGVLVDDHMRTNVPDIWAAGDLAEHRGLTYGLWTVAREQGKIAGENMAGVDSVYEGSLPSTLLKITGISVFSMGDVNQSAHENLVGQDEDSYKKLSMMAGVPQSAIVIGDKAAITTTQKILSGKASPEEFRKFLPEEKE